MVEVVRRKEFSALLQGLADRLNEEMQAYLGGERTRRSDVRSEALSQLPWTVPALEDEGLEWATKLKAGNEALSGLHVGRDDIQGTTVS